MEPAEMSDESVPLKVVGYVGRAARGEGGGTAPASVPEVGSN